MSISENYTNSRCTEIVHLRIMKALQSSKDPERYLTLFSEKSFKDLRPGEVVVELFDIKLFFKDERHVLACHHYALEKM